MNPQTILGIVFMLLALLSYSISIWGARKNKGPKLLHVVLAWVGLACDTTGTLFMAAVAGGLSWSLHGITGYIAIFMMVVNAIWVTVAFVKKQESITKSYLIVSVIIWFVWLISLFTGMALAMG